MEQVNWRVISWVKTEMESADIQRTNISVVSSDSEESFWKGFEKDAQNSTCSSVTSLDVEIQRWGGLSPLSISTNPIPAMEALKKEYPRIYTLFRKYCVYPATQNRDERIFSMVAQNTNPLRRSIHVDSVMSAKMMLEAPFGIMDSFIITKTAPNLAQMMMTNKTCSMILFFSNQ